jgi:polyhydroxyalkanoate synthesis regulator phasin
MSQIDGLKRYLEAGLAFSQITRARAEEAVRELIQSGEVESNKAQEWVEHLVSTSKDRSEAFISTVRSEVRTQLAEVGLTNVDELARRVANILERGQAAARKASKRPAGGSTRKAAKKTASRAAGKKSSSKRAPAKKTAKRATAKTTAKRAPAKKTAERATAKKAAKKTASTRRAGG